MMTMKMMIMVMVRRIINVNDECDGDDCYICDGRTGSKTDDNDDDDNSSSSSSMMIMIIMMTKYNDKDRPSPNRTP